MSKKYEIDMGSGEVTPFDSQAFETNKLESQIIEQQNDLEIDEPEIVEDPVKDPIVDVIEDPTLYADDDADDVNPFFYIAQELKDDGVLPESFKITNAISYNDIYNATKSNLETSIADSIKEEVYGALQEQGINEHDLGMAKALRAGVHPNLLYEAGRYEYYSKMDSAAATETQKYNVLNEMWTDKGYSDREIRRLKEAIELDDSLDEELDYAKKYFDDKYKNFVARTDQSMAQQEQAKKQLLANQRQKVQDIIMRKEVNGEKLTEDQAKKLENGWTKATEIAEVQGQKYKVTPFQKYLLDFNNNIETQLYAFKKHLFKGKEADEIEQEAKSKWEDEFLKNHKAITTRDVSSTRNNKIRKEIEGARSTKKTYTIG